MKVLPPLFLMVFLSASVCTCIYADIIINESFESYPAGPLVDNETEIKALGLTGSFRIVGENKASIVSGSMSYVGGSLTVNGGAQYLELSGTSRFGAVNEELSARIDPADGSLFQSFLYRFNGPLNSRNGGSAAFQSSIKGSNSTNNMGTQSSGSKLRTFVGRANTSTVSGAVVEDTVYFIVVEYIASGGEWTGANVWINPESSVQVPPTYTVTGAASNTVWRALSSIAANLDEDDSINVDRYSVGRTWSDVVSVP